MKLILPLLGVLAQQPTDNPSPLVELKSETSGLVQMVALPPQDTIMYGTERKSKPQMKYGVNPQMRGFISSHVEQVGIDKVNFGIQTPKREKAFSIIGHGYNGRTTVEYELFFSLGGTDSYSVRILIDSPNAEILFRLTNVLGRIIGGKYQRKMSEINIQELYGDLQKANIIRNTTSKSE